jgi:hypothetical protein
LPSVPWITSSGHNPRKTEDLKATYRDGMLKLSAPMPKEAVPKEVKIQVESATASAEKKA